MSNTKETSTDSFKARVFTSYAPLDHYCQEWLDEMCSNAYFNLARDHQNKQSPFCTRVAIEGGVINDLFTVSKWSEIRYDVIIFDNDESMDRWIEEHGSDKISHAIYITGKFR